MAVQAGRDTYRVGNDSIAGHLQEALHSQILQYCYRQAAVHVFGRECRQSLRAVLFLQCCLKISAPFWRHHIPAMQELELSLDFARKA